MCLAVLSLLGSIWVQACLLDSVIFLQEFILVGWQMGGGGVLGGRVCEGWTQTKFGGCGSAVVAVICLNPE